MDISFVGNQRVKLATCIRKEEQFFSQENSQQTERKFLDNTNGCSELRKHTPLDLQKMFIKDAQRAITFQILGINI